MEGTRYEHSDELIDELDATLMRFGRLMASRHASERCAHEVADGPRLVMLHLLRELGPLKAGDLAQLLGIKAPATSSLLDALEAEGYVVRERDAQDRRVTRVRMTEAGLSAMHSADAHRREKMRDYLAVLPEDDIRAMIRIQRTLMSAFSDDQD